MQRQEKHLQRLTFKVRSNSTEKGSEPNSEPHDFTFIYGIGADGLSDFEIAIDELGLDEHFSLEIDRTKLASYFGWLYHYLHTSVPLPAVGGIVNLQLQLQTISSPEPREVVAAIAELQSHGSCGTDCGCGCH